MRFYMYLGIPSSIQKLSSRKELSNGVLDSSVSHLEDEILQKLLTNPGESAPSCSTSAVKQV